MEDEMSVFGLTPRVGDTAGTGGGNKCGRWNPTSEQVKLLTELFHSGLRTPSTEQIQKISKELSLYGKIESKNVFYWFQNHKARERQKRRRVFVDVDDEHHEPNHHFHDHHHLLLHHHDYKISSTKHFADVNQVLGRERVIETLQLFPLNSVDGSDSEKMRLLGHDCKENYTFVSEIGHPPLDLRLSFM